MVKLTRLQVLFAALLLLSVELSAANAQTFSIASVSASTPNFGNLGAALSGSTVFAVTSGGIVSVVSGTGGDTPSGSQAAATVAIGCSNPNCSSGTAIVKIGALAGVTGRASAVSSFTVSSGTATVGTVTTNGDGSIQFPVTNLNKDVDRTILVGMRMPIAGDNTSSSTSATAKWTVAVAKSPTVPTLPGTTGTATATVRKSISATTTALSFGPLRRPSSGSGTIIINASTGSRTAGGTVPPGLATGGSSGRGTVVVAGQGSTTFTIGLTSPFNLSNGTTTLSSTAVASAAGPYTLTAAGAYTLGVGGVLTVPSTATTGNYTGAVTATVAYN